MTTSDLVPGVLPVAIDGHPYLIDPAAYQRATVQVLRQQADTSFEPGEESLNPQGLWRRSQESFHHGAGQDFLDGRRGRSAYSQVSQDPEQFRSSKGIDPWTKGKLSLLHPTLKAWSTTNTNLYLAVAQFTGTIFALYVADGTELYLTALPFNASNTIGLQHGVGWVATNATIAPSTTWFSLTATSAAAVSAHSPTGTSGYRVDPGRRYGAQVLSFYVSGGSGRIPQISVSWYDAGGTLISTTATSAALGNDAAPSGAAAVISGGTVAPANAATASVNVSYTTNFASGEVHNVTQVGFGPYDDTTPFAAPDVWYAADIQASQPAKTIQSIATDGHYVWAALGTSGLHRTVAGNTTSTSDVPPAIGAGQISLVGYANGFLLAAGSASSATGQNVLWQVNDPLGTPTLSAIKTHPNDTFVWTGISQGRNCVYAYGNSGANGEVYKITIDPNTGALSTAASFATYLPDGETIHALQFYAGMIVMGTGKGVRIGQADGSGNIDYGPLVSTTWPVRCLEPQDRYCWFGWTKYDSTNSGLGRIDLGFQTDNLTPAWASDLMTPDTTSGDVVAAVTFSPYMYTSSQRPPIRVFTVAGSGVYVEDPGSRVPSGQLLTGTIRFSTSEPKVARSVDIRHHALPAGASVAVDMQRDASGTWEPLGTSSVTGSYGPATPIDALSETAESLEFRLTLTRPDHNGTDYSQTPELVRWTAKVLPAPSTIDETFDLAVIMKEKVETTSGQPYPVDVAAEVAFLKDLEQSRRIVEFQVGDETFSGYVLQSQFTGAYWGPGREYMEGQMLVRMQTVRG